MGIPASATLSGGPEGTIQRMRAEAAMPGILASAGFAVPEGGVLNNAVETIQRALVEGVRRDLDRYGEWAGNADAGLSSITITSPPPPAPKTLGLTSAALVDRYLAAPEWAGLRT